MNEAETRAGLLTPPLAGKCREGRLEGGWPNTALRLGKALNTSPAFWMNMQARFDLEVAEDALAGAIKDRTDRRGSSLGFVKPALGECIDAR